MSDFLTGVIALWPWLLFLFLAVLTASWAETTYHAPENDPLRAARGIVGALLITGLCASLLAVLWHVS